MYLGKGVFPPVKNFVSVIASPDISVKTIQKDIELSIGKVDLISEAYPFDFTNYYQSEMGDGLVRVFFALSELTQADGILNIKKKCLALENAFSQDDKRSINFDPGYIDLFKLILVSEKYMGHKIYLSDGICADLTLLLGKNKVTPFMWTFPDFKSGRYDEFILKMRRHYRSQLKEIGI